MSDTILHLLRHGAVAETGRLLGRKDEPSTAAGIQACLHKANGLEIDRIVTSPLLRARTAAEAIAAARGASARADERWAELDFGTWDGLRADQVDEGALRLFYEDPGANPPPGGESWQALVGRVAAAIGARPGGRTLVVTHGGPMRAALAQLCGLDHRQVWAFDLPCAALLSIRLFPGQPASGQVIGLRA